MERTLEERIEEERTKWPNLWRVACELSKFKDPYKALDLLLAIAGPMLKGSQDGQQQF